MLMMMSINSVMGRLAVGGGEGVNGVSRSSSSRCAAADRRVKSGRGSKGMRGDHVYLPSVTSVLYNGGGKSLRSFACLHRDNEATDADTMCSLGSPLHSRLFTNKTY